MKYSFDTSAFIAPYRHIMPPDIVPSLWTRYDDLIKSGDIVASKEVYEEIDRKDDGLLEWVDERKEMFIEVNLEQQSILRTIINAYPDWVDKDAQKNIADPYVIALAMHLDLIVVSAEKGGSTANPSIPFVCKAFGISHMHFFEFLRHIGFRA